MRKMLKGVKVLIEKLKIAITGERKKKTIDKIR